VRETFRRFFACPVKFGKNLIWGYNRIDESKETKNSPRNSRQDFSKDAIKQEDKISLGANNVLFEIKSFKWKL